MRKSKAIQLMLAIFAFSLLLTAPLLAADSAIGTWILKSSTVKIPGEVTMTIEAWGPNGGRKITDVFHTPDGKAATMSITTAMDGSDATVLVNGQPIPDTMAIKKVDDFHTVTVLKSKGKQYGISRATLSPDYKTITVENEITNAIDGHQIGKHTEVWVRK